APVGLVVSGVLAEQVGISTWFIICGALTIACCAAGLASKSIRSLDDQS
ncbi:MAG TPA: MFS transporter, partial [Candidatus Aveggerthella stercoripullorum]|nr:MFS transporter [Candidatus Aveggerthella stercoripullorum]